MEYKRERLAAVQHEIWSSWMEYLFNQCDYDEDGAATIPTGLVSRWQRQVSTEYHTLSEAEKESDRHQADKVIAVLNS